MISTFPTLLKFPLGGAQQELERVSRMFSGAFRKPFQNAFAAGSGAATLGLLSYVIAWWELDEASGNRADSHTNTLTLTDNNTVTSNPGIGGVGTAAQFTAANGESLSRNSSALLQIGSNAFHVVQWVYFDSLPGNQRTFSKDDVGANREYLLQVSSGGVPLWLVWTGAAAIKSISWTGTAMTTATWCMLDFYFNPATQKLGVAVNAGTPDEVDTATGTMAALSANLHLGANNGVNEFMGGRMAKTAIFNKVLSSGERASLYNGGAGVTYGEL